MWSVTLTIGEREIVIAAVAVAAVFLAGYTVGFRSAATWLDRIRGSW